MFTLSHALVLHAPTACVSLLQGTQNLWRPWASPSTCHSLQAQASTAACVCGTSTHVWSVPPAHTLM